MSFFDDEDDAIDPEPRRSARSSAPPRPRGGSGGGAGGSGSGARPPRSGAPRRPADPAIERRRWIAVAVIVVVVILMILLISSCQASNTRNSLEDYATSVSQQVSNSNATGVQVFKDLKAGGSNLPTDLSAARSELAAVEGLSVPGQMTSAQRNVVLAFQMRVNGIKEIANNVTAATGSSSSQATVAVNNIAGGTAQFYASDVVYIDYAAQDIVEALHGDNIPTAGRINGKQFLTDLGWLQTSFISTTIGATAGSSSTSGSAASFDASQKCTTSPASACVHGTNIDSAAVGSNTMSTAATNSVAGSPAPTFTITFTNGGTYAEEGIKCSVSVSGGPSGTGVVTGVTDAGATGECTVKLSGTVQTGTYPVKATVEGVPGETNLTNNSENFEVSFS